MRNRLLGTLLAIVAASAAHAGTEVRLWQALDPALAQQLAAAVQSFNASQAEFHIKVLPARRALPGGVERIALPLSADRPLLYYNEDAFRRAGLDPQAPPRTWYAMAGTLGALADSGQRCPYTTAWPSWVMLGANAGQFDRQLLVRWVSMLSSWQSARYFSYSGRLDQAEARFSSGECAVLTASSGSEQEIARRAHFALGVAPLPRYDDFAAGPQSPPRNEEAVWAQRNSVGVAKFYAFLAQRAAALRRQREAIDHALEAVWSGKSTPVDALKLVSY